MSRMPCYELPVIEEITGPAILNIFAPTPKTYPSAAVNIGHTHLQKHLH